MTTLIERSTGVTHMARQLERYLSCAVVIVSVFAATGCQPPAPADPENDNSADLDLGPDGTREVDPPDGPPDEPAPTLVAFEFDVTVTHSGADSIAVGQRGTGRIMYDTDDAARFAMFDAPPAIFELEIGSVVLIAGSKTSGAGPDLQIDVRNDQVVNMNEDAMDALNFWGTNIAREIDGFHVDMALLLQDTASAVLSDRSIPMAVPVLSDYDRSRVQIRYEQPLGSGITYGLMSLSIDAITEITDAPAGGTDTPADGTDDDQDTDVPGDARTVYVAAVATAGGDGTSWANAFTYLQDALAVANTGDEIHVAEGTYRPDQDEAGYVGLGDRLATFQLLSDIAIYGGYAGPGAPDPDVRDIGLCETTLSGDLSRVCVQDVDCGEADGLCVDGFCTPTQGDYQNSFHVVTGSSTGPTAILDGFTITAGIANGNNPHNTGAGMYNAGGSPTVANCTFTGNSALARAFLGWATGGGMYNSGSNPTVTNCSFSANTASGFGAGGGGMSNNSSSPAVKNCTFFDNSASNGGGMFNNENSSPIVTDCMFAGNSAAEHGGAMYNVVNSHAAVTNCTFSGNKAASGGGMYNHMASNALVTNCTFSGNAGGFFGGGIINRDSNTRITNCILWGNNASQIYNIGLTGTAEVNYSIVQGGWSGAGGIAIIDSDPLFIDSNGPDDAFGDGDDNLRVMPGSPAIDAGNNAAVPDGILHDIEGNPRIVDNPNTPDCPEPGADCGTPPIVDMGAFEIPGR